MWMHTLRTRRARWPLQQDALAQHASQNDWPSHTAKQFHSMNRSVMFHSGKNCHKNKQPRTKCHGTKCHRTKRYFKTLSCSVSLSHNEDSWRQRTSDIWGSSPFFLPLPLRPPSQGRPPPPLPSKKWHPLPSHLPFPLPSPFFSFPLPLPFP